MLLILSHLQYITGWITMYCYVLIILSLISVEAGMGHVLDPEDVDSLFEVVKSAKSKWRDIGRELGFALKEVENVVQKKGISQDQDYFQELLDLWLNWAPPERPFPCTEDLLEALRRIGQHRLALKLENTEKLMRMKDLVKCGLQQDQSFTSVSGEGTCMIDNLMILCDLNDHINEVNQYLV